MSLSMTGEQFRSVVQAGVLAPSADNHHPFLFQRTDDGIIMRGDREFLNAAYHRRILLRMSAGAVVQNMVLEAGRLGFGVRFRWFPDAADRACIARLEFGSEHEPDPELAHAIPLRHTNRRLRFSGPAVPRAVLGRLEADVKAVAGAQLVWLDGPETRRKALSLIRLAEAERFRCRPMHQELFSSVRFDVGWGRTAEEGLAPGALGVERLLHGAFAMLRHWPVMRALNLVGGYQFMGFRAGDLPCRLSPHLAVIVTDLPVESGAMAVGQAFERVWLRANAVGLALQPLAASALFTLEGYADVRESIRHQLARGWADIVGDARPLIVFRLGMAEAPAIRCGRRALETYVVQDHA